MATPQQITNLTSNQNMTMHAHSFTQLDHGSLLIDCFLKRDLLNQFLCLEESSQIENLPRSQTKQATHAEDAEE